MTRSILTEHDVQQLQDLYRQIPGHVWTAANRLNINSSARALEGEDLKRFLEAHERVVDILDRTRKILG